MSAPAVLHASSRPATASPAPPAVVLDTNVVLDWLVFRDPSCASLTRHFAEGRLRWLASLAMRNELEHVLARGGVHAWAPDLEALWRTWDALALTMPPGTPDGPALRVRCTDADDQKFIDLALAYRARWLLSRDRAVLRTARRTKPLGLEVLTPEAWLRALSAG